MARAPKLVGVLDPPSARRPALLSVPIGAERLGAFGGDVLPIFSDGETALARGLRP
jgi:hypothetical protein